MRRGRQTEHKCPPLGTESRFFERSHWLQGVCINSEVPRPDGHASKKGPPGRGALIGEKDRAGSKLNLQVGHSPTDDRRTEGKKRSVVVQLL